MVKSKDDVYSKGNGTREWLTKEDTSSPTASLEAITVTCVIDAFERRDMMSLDLHNAYIQTLMPEDAKAQVMMKITGSLVDMMIKIDPTYPDYVVMENGKQVIYVQVLRAIYGMLEAGILWYESSEQIWKPMDLFSIHTIHASQIKL